ncbi:MAG: hypothetical protein GWN62_02290, partial [Aliifodinibius sp.]|nr:hypothetical protein [Fodinibius sp.]
VGGGSFTEKIYVNLSAATSGGFIYFGPTSDISSNGHTPRVVVPLQIRRNVSNATLEIHADIQTDGIIYDIGTLANDATPS